MKKYTSLLPFLLVMVTSVLLKAQTFSLSSLDGDLTINIYINDHIYFNVISHGETVIEDTPIAFTVNGKVLGLNPALIDQKEVRESNEIIPVLPQKNKVIKDEYKELQLTFEGNYALHFRVYNEGFAYRWGTSMDEEIEIDGEQMDLNLPSGSTSTFPQEEVMYSHYERTYLDKKVADIADGEFASLPTLFTTPGGQRIVLSDADLFDYPNAFIKGTAEDHLALQFPKYVLEAVPSNIGSDRNQKITKEAEFIAKCEGTRTYPWRMFAIAAEDKELLDNEMVFKLSRPNQLKNTDWIKPGRVAWDWYNANNIYGVDFKSGINNETYKYYIDFASKYGIEWVILDEGWTKSTTEILECNPDINVKELVAYGKERGVGIILWCLWKPLDENTEEILDLYASWGVKGVKIDFMQRADQYMVNSFRDIAVKAAERSLLVDYHGAFKPAGLRRAYPNVISYEGVKGNEHNKWSSDITPTHCTTLPFIRNLVGPMDFTPGAMVNMNPQFHHVNFLRPAGMGSRAFQVSMYFIFESAIQMFCDSPSAYLKDGKTIEYLSRIPSVWDETYALDARLGEYVVMARRKGDRYFVGAMNNEEARSLEIDFSFLPSGNFEATIFKDGINARTYMEDYEIVKMEVNKDTKIKLDLIGSGGWSAIIEKR